MKNLILSLAFMLLSTVVFANNTNVSKVVGDEISNTELSITTLPNDVTTSNTLLNESNLEDNFVACTIKYKIVGASGTTAKGKVKADTCEEALDAVIAIAEAIQ